MRKISCKKLRVAINERGRRIGDSHPRAALSDADVALIRDLRDAGLSYGVIAKKFEVAKSTVARICLCQNRSQFADGFKTVIEVDMQIEKIETITAVHPVLGETVMRTTYVFNTGDVVHKYHDGALALPGALSGRVFAKLQAKIREYENAKGGGK